VVAARGIVEQQVLGLPARGLPAQPPQRLALFALAAAAVRGAQALLEQARGMVVLASLLQSQDRRWREREAAVVPITILLTLVQRLGEAARVIIQPQHGSLEPKAR
jgi:hypothetical protein